MGREDENGRERIRRHHRRFLPSFMPGASSIQVRESDRRDLQHPYSGSWMRSQSDPCTTEHDELWIRDGPDKYVGACTLQENNSRPLLRISNSNPTRYHVLRLSKIQRPLPLISLIRDRGLKFEMPGALAVIDIRIILLGGLTTLIKIFGLLLTRTFCDALWPYLQVFSLCTLTIQPLKCMIPQLAQAAAAAIPLQGLAGPMLSLMLARPIIRWGFPDAYRTARFWRRLLPIYCGYMITKQQARGKSTDERDKLWAKRHEWGGDKVHRLVLDLSGFYVKSAQILATKADFVPEAWIRHLSNHFDNEPPRPFAEVAKSITKQLGRCQSKSMLPVNANGLVPLYAVFREVDPVAIAAASIAQVHGAVLKNGSRVVIKVQHLGMETVMKSDLRNIVWVAKFLEGQLPFDLGPIVREIQATIPLEFDFEREIWFMTFIKKSLEANKFDHIVCPAPITEFCAKRLIVMERLDGIPFTHILHGGTQDMHSRLPELVQLVEFLMQAYGQMLLVDGVFHADPHAGNLLLLSDGRLGLIDYGQSKVIGQGIRRQLAKMVIALHNNDETEIARNLIQLGMVFKDVNGGVVSESTLAMLARILFDTCYVREATVSPMAHDSILRTTPLTSFNQSLWMVVRAMVLLRGLCFSLNMNLSASALWRPYAELALQEVPENEA